MLQNATKDCGFLSSSSTSERRTIDVSPFRETFVLLSSFFFLFRCRCKRDLRRGTIFFYIVMGPHKKDENVAQEVDVADKRSECAPWKDPGKLIMCCVR